MDINPGDNILNDNRGVAAVFTRGYVPLFDNNMPLFQDGYYGTGDSGPGGGFEAFEVSGTDIPSTNTSTISVNITDPKFIRLTDLDHLLSRGYSFQQEVLYRCRKAGCRIGETPILFENRRAGSSKVNPHEAARSMAVIFLVGVRAFFGTDK